MPYLMGFVKTAILASLGEMLADRIVTKKYFACPGIALRFLVGRLGHGLCSGCFKSPRSVSLVRWQWLLYISQRDDFGKNSRRVFHEFDHELDFCADVWRGCHFHH
ncbi:MAG: hypothetical protein MZU97_17250 [Bacillus subtilis]|nr:hypothetical protein [Bacillus subtilis]